MPERLDSAPVEARLARRNGGVARLRRAGRCSDVSLTEVNVKGVEFGPVLVDFLCQPYAVTGPLDLTGEALLRLPTIARPRRCERSVAGRIKIGPGKVTGGTSSHS